MKQAEVLVVPASGEETIPVSKAAKVRKHYADTRTRQAYLGRRGRQIYGLLYGGSQEGDTFFYRPLPPRKGGAPGRAYMEILLEALKTGVQQGKGPLHLRHNFGGFSSAYVTFALLEETPITTAPWRLNRGHYALAGEIRGLLDYSDVTIFDESPYTSRLRDMYAQTSANKPTSRYLLRRERL